MIALALFAVLLAAAPQEAPAPTYRSLLKSGCTPIALRDDIVTCVRFDKHEDADLGTVLSVEVFVDDEATHRPRLLDRLIVPTHYGKASGDVVTIGNDMFKRQAISVLFEGGTGTGYLEMLWLLVGLDADSERLVARAYEPVSGHLGSLHTQHHTTTMKWTPRDNAVRLSHTWRTAIGAKGMTTSGGGTITWTDDLVCGRTCYNDGVEKMLADDEALFAPRRRLARARVWFASGGFDLHDRATWKLPTLLLADLDP